MFRTLIKAAALALLTLPATAQVRTLYQQTISNAAYTTLPGDSSIGGTGDDDQQYNDIRLGFSFTYNGLQYDRVNILNNGGISFGSTANTFSGTGSSIVSASNPTGTMLTNYEQSLGVRGPVIAGFNMDLVKKSSQSSKMSITRSGNAGNRRFTIQWEAYSRYGSDVTTDNINFQLTLNEANGGILVHFGSNTIDAARPCAAHVGIRGADTTDVLNLTGTWSSLTRGAFALDKVTTNDQSAPQPGTLISYLPGSPNAIDGAVTSLVKPVPPTDGICSNALTDTVRFVFTNFGSDPVSSVSAGYILGAAAPVTQTFTLPAPLNFGASATLTFTQLVTFSGATNYRLRVYVSQPNDASVSNDTLTRNLIINTSTGSPIYPMWMDDFGNQVSSTVPGWTNTVLTTGSILWRTDTLVFDPGLGAPLNPVSNNGFAFFNSFLSGTRGNQSRINSPCLNLSNWPANEPIWLDFTFAQNTDYPNRRDSISIQVGVDGANYTTIAGYRMYDANTSSTTWKHFTVDLSAYRNRVIKLGIVGISDGGANMGIDYVRVQNVVPVRTGSIVLGQPIKVYPNPAQDRVRISLPTGDQYNTVQITNATGQVVREIPAVQSELEVDLSNLSNGIYHVRAVGATYQFTRTITKQ